VINGGGALIRHKCRPTSNEAAVSDRVLAAGEDPEKCKRVFRLSQTSLTSKTSAVQCLFKSKLPRGN